MYKHNYLIIDSIKKHTKKFIQNNDIGTNMNTSKYRCHGNNIRSETNNCQQKNFNDYLLVLMLIIIITTIYKINIFLKISIT